jgi:hypothetical protein
MSNHHRNFSRKHIKRDRESANKRVEADYFIENPVYNDVQFRQRYRIRKHLFLHIVDTLSNWSPYFCQRNDAFGKEGLLSLHKCTIGMRMLAYGTSANMWDENFRIVETTTIECMKHFCKGVIENFGENYLHGPTSQDIQ